VKEDEKQWSFIKAMDKFDDLVPRHIEGRDRAIALTLLEEYYSDEDRFSRNEGEDASSTSLNEDLKLLECEANYDGSGLEVICKFSFFDYHYMKFSEWWQILPERLQSMLDAGCEAGEIEAEAENLMIENIRRIASELS
jgi:hypothetical protein